MLTKDKLKPLIEAIIMVAGKPMTETQIINVLKEDERPPMSDIRQALFELQESYQDRGIELIQVASGYKFQARKEYSSWVSTLWEEKPAKYSRALFETLALIAYKQPITRGEIEDIRGVSISSSIFRILQDDRSWIRVVGHKDVPGRPGIYATTKQFLDYFGLKSLEQLPLLPEILNLADAEINGVNEVEADNSSEDPALSNDDEGQLIGSIDESDIKENSESMEEENEVI